MCDISKKELNEEKTRLFVLVSMVQALKKSAEGASSYEEAKTVYNQYHVLRKSLISIDAEAISFIPKLAFRASAEALLERTKIAIDQMLSYIYPRVFPVFIDLAEWAKKFGILGIGEPMSKLSPILIALGLSPNWAVAASALCSIEVLVNRKLNELGMTSKGKFQDRVKRLSSKAKKKGVDLPNLLAPAFYDVRSKVIHGGREPTPDELNTILQFLNLFLQKTTKLKP